MASSGSGTESDGVVTEVVYLPIKSGLNPTELSKTLHHTLSTIASQPGCLSIHYNYIKEQPLSHILELHQQWSTLQHHKDFENSEIYSQFYNDVKGVLAGDVGMFHMKKVAGWKLDSNEINKIMAAKGEVAGDAIANATKKEGESIPPRRPNPTLEVTTSFCNENSGFLENAKKFIAGLQDRKIPGLLGASGYTVLERIPPFFKKEGEEKKVYAEVVVGMISWADMEAHKAFSESDGFAEAISVLQGIEDFEGHHVDFLEFKK